MSLASRTNTVRSRRLLSAGLISSACSGTSRTKIFSPGSVGREARRTLTRLPCGSRLTTAVERLPGGPAELTRVAVGLQFLDFFQGGGLFPRIADVGDVGDAGRPAGTTVDVNFRLAAAQQRF